MASAACSFFSSSTLLYICVVRMLVWPNILLIVYRSVPFESCKQAYVWRKQWKVMCFVIPAASIHLESGLEIHEGEGSPPNTSLSGWPGSPQKKYAWSDIGVYSTPFVFFWVKLMR